MIEPSDDLKQRGINRAVSNRQPGQTIALPDSIVITLFGAELLRCLDKKESQNAG